MSFIRRTIVKCLKYAALGTEANDSNLACHRHNTASPEFCGKHPDLTCPSTIQSSVSPHIGRFVISMDFEVSDDSFFPDKGIFDMWNWGDGEGFTYMIWGWFWGFGMDLELGQIIIDSRWGLK
ncbi:hypothetical protein Tco_0370859 [Tanacetum coccineum]